MASELLARVQRATEEGRKRGAETVDAVVPSSNDDAIVYVVGWLNGLEDALVEIVDEIDRLAARLDDANRA